MSIRDKYLKNSKLEKVGLMTDIEEKEFAPTSVPIMNLALSGKLLEGGVSAGALIFAGKSKHFKTLFGLICVKAFFDKYEDATCIFYDTEMGASLEYFEMQGIDTDRVVHKLVPTVVDLKMEMSKDLELIEKGERVIFFWDSLGNIASKKEVEDAKDGKYKQDMTRAKQIKSLTRTVTVPLMIKKVPLIVVGHIYMTQDMYPKPVVSGGDGPYYLANDIFIIGRQKDKDNSKKELEGYNFILNTEKSRTIKEGSKFPVNVKFSKEGKGGVNQWSGLLDIAVSLGYVTKPTAQLYQRDCLIGNDKFEDQEAAQKKFKKKATSVKDFWLPIFKNTDFTEAVENAYSLSGDGSTLINEEIFGEIKYD